MTTHTNLSAEERSALDEASIWFDRHRGEFSQDLLDWVSIPSVSDTRQAREGEPYGPQVARMFRAAAQRASDFGLNSTDREGHALEVWLGDDGSELGDIALVSHLDVVPAGQGWTFEPFKPVERAGYVIGRGSSDNKLGALTDLYLLRFLNERFLGKRPLSERPLSERPLSEQPLSKRPLSEQSLGGRGTHLRHNLHIIYGGAEETTLDDLRYYVAHYGAPRQAVVTDSPFPANNAQKGHLVLDIHLPAGPVLSTLDVGGASNAVPGHGTIALPASLAAVPGNAFDDLDAETRGRLSILTATDGKGLVLEAEGVAGHAAFPDGTSNAIILLVRGLLAIDRHTPFLDDRDCVTAETIVALFHSPYAEGSPIAFCDEESGRTTQNLGVVHPSRTGDGVDLTVDIRYAVTQHGPDIERALAGRLQAAGGSITHVERSDPFFVPKDDPRLQALLSAYNDVIGVHEEPNAMGGGTHARVIPGALNFGPGFGGLTDANGERISRKPDFIEDGKGSAHGADEWASIDDAKTAFLIYLLGVLRLDAVLDADD